MIAEYLKDEVMAGFFDEHGIVVWLTCLLR